MTFWICLTGMSLAMGFLAGFLGVDRTYASVTIVVIFFTAAILREVLTSAREKLLHRIVGGTHIRMN